MTIFKTFTIIGLVKLYGIFTNNHRIYLLGISTLGQGRATTVRHASPLSPAGGTSRGTGRRSMVVTRHWSSALIATTSATGRTTS